MSEKLPGNGITRRDFVRKASVAAAATAAVGGSPSKGQEAAEAGAIPKRTLGKTEKDVTVVCFGSYGLTNPGVLDAAMDAGVDLIDTGPRYAEGQAERVIGEVMKKRRDEVVLSTKFTSTGPGVPCCS